MTPEELSQHLAYLAGVSQKQAETRRQLATMFSEPVAAYHLGELRSGAPKDDPRTVADILREEGL